MPNEWGTTYPLNIDASSGFPALETIIKPLVSVDTDTTTSFEVKFKLNIPAFNGLLSPKFIEEEFKKQSKVFIADAIGQLLKDEEFKNDLKPKIKEHLMSMTLSEVMEQTNLDLPGVLELFKD